MQPYLRGLGLTGIQARVQLPSPTISMVTASPLLLTPLYPWDSVNMSRVAQTTRYRDAVLSRADIKAHIAQGRKIVIVEGRVLKVDAWLPYHPGGDKAILHMVGRDATNEIKAFHSVQTRQLMHKYQIGRIDEQWEDFVPPIQGGVFEEQVRRAEHRTMVGTGDVLDVLHDASEDEQSVEPSPVFEAAEHRTSSLRRRRASDDAASHSSATSLDTLDLPLPISSPKDSQREHHRTSQDDINHDLDIFPNLDAATQSNIISKYRQLDARIDEAGLYDCNYAAYLSELLRYTVLGSLSYYCLVHQFYALSAVFLGLLWHQLVFTVHDAGHIAITHNYHVDTTIGILISDFLGGLSVCWWKQNHNVHHIVTNSPSHDPDIQHMPFFAITPQFFQSLTSTYYDRLMPYDAFAKFLTRHQHKLYYPILTLGRFNLYLLSWQYIFLGQGPRKGPAWWHRYLEMVGQLFFWYWFGYLVVYRSIPTACQRLFFIAISHAITMPVHVQITLSHFAMSTADLGVAESFPQRMLRTTMDVDCPAWLDFFHGGLQFQAVHHLFPRVPRHNLRKCQGMVREFCEDVGIPYAIYGFREGNEKVLGRLEEVARQARLLGECSKSLGPADVFDSH